MSWLKELASLHCFPAGVFATERSNQEFAPGDMGLMVSFALQQFKMAHVGSGSRAVLINRH